ncbi:putative LuxR family transcriptional regulator [Kitasatospora setae KM-6054]|uniref:Putative LuxR family transcriptional regulator n=1 Tax=Kitasatospora setae (strain ATCC 33774 / DSM 43861 / JCM 3304 / KCC A-0304 / NBRC 14216 / KM-6054) TaxID=452652 RepID=E4N0P9_KITSK|nr:putative LuxR family transcriptional regulator [Kitasatospora setae KM-6054]
MGPHQGAGQDEVAAGRVVGQHPGDPQRHDPLERLSPREREVLGLMAQGRSNANLAAELFVSDAAVNKHIGNIFAKLDLPADADGHRRVLAVLRFLGV